MKKSKYFKIINEIDDFYSFVEDDFFKIYPDSTKVKYSFLSYLHNENLNHDKDSILDENLLMIGHSGSPLLNHLQVIDTINLKNENYKILIPVTNGNKSYIKKLMHYSQKEKILNIEFLKNRLPLKDYYKLLSSVSIFFINSYCQLGLGNIVFFLKNGTTIYLSEKSSTYSFLKRKGFIVFSIESLRNSSKIQKLSIEERTANKQKIEELLSIDNVKEQWKKLIEN